MPDEVTDPAKDPALSGRIFYRLVKSNPPTVDDMLSQAAQRKPCPLPDDPNFVRRWEGLSVFDNEEETRNLGRNRRRRGRAWSLGEYIATLRIPPDAPITSVPPEEEGSGHWLLYGVEERMLDEDGAVLLIDCVVRVVHGPSTGG